MHLVCPSWLIADGAVQVLRVGERHRFPLSVGDASFGPAMTSPAKYGALAAAAVEWQAQVLEVAVDASGSSVLLTEHGLCLAVPGAVPLNEDATRRRDVRIRGLLTVDPFAWDEVSGIVPREHHAWRIVSIDLCEAPLVPAAEGGGAQAADWNAATSGPVHVAAPDYSEGVVEYLIDVRD